MWLESRAEVGVRTPGNLLVHPCLYTDFHPDVISAKHTTPRVPNGHKQKQRHHHEEGIAIARDKTFLPMIDNVIMQAVEHIKLNLPISPSYKLNWSENLFVRALAIFIGTYGKSRYTY